MNIECKGCTVRTPGCHDRCEAYKAFKQFQADLKKKQMAERMTTMYTPTAFKKMHEYKQRYRRENK